VITDNLASLFASGPDAVRFRQGTITAWNANTGANTITVAGGTLTDVPILNTGEAIALKAGHIVGLLAFGSAWFILGRITPAGDPNFAGASVDFDGVHNSATNFGLTTTPTNKVTATLTVPDWADEALVQLTSTVSLFNNNAASGYYTVFQPFIDGVGGGGGGFGVAPAGHASFNDSNSTAVAYQRLITNPGPTISLAVTGAVTLGTFPTVANNTIILDATAIFRSTI
jgi:hypothetical protein